MEIEIGNPHYHLRKSTFGYKNKSHDFEDATWDWVLKRGYLPRDRDPAPHRNIVLDYFEVLVWDQHHQPTNPQLTLQFPPTKTGLKEAKSYINQILETGAIMADVTLFISFPYKALVQVETRTYTNKAAYEQG